MRPPELLQYVGLSVEYLAITLIQLLLHSEPEGAELLRWQVVMVFVDFDHLYLSITARLLDIFVTTTRNER